MLPFDCSKKSSEPRKSYYACPDADPLRFNRQARCSSFGKHERKPHLSSTDSIAEAASAILDANSLAFLLTGLLQQRTATQLSDLRLLGNAWLLRTRRSPRTLLSILKHRLPQAQCLCTMLLWHHDCYGHADPFADLQVSGLSEKIQHSLNVLHLSKDFELSFAGACKSWKSTAHPEAVPTTTPSNSGLQHVIECGIALSSYLISNHTVQRQSHRLYTPHLTDPRCRFPPFRAASFVVNSA